MTAELLSFKNIKSKLAIYFHLLLKERKTQIFIFNNYLNM